MVTAATLCLQHIHMEADDRNHDNRHIGDALGTQRFTEYHCADDH